MGTLIKKLYSVWNLFRLALSGGESNILSGNINRAILLLAVELSIGAAGVYWTILISETIFTTVGYFLFKKVDGKVLRCNLQRSSLDKDNYQYVVM